MTNLLRPLDIAERDPTAPLAGAPRTADGRRRRGAPPPSPGVGKILLLLSAIVFLCSVPEARSSPTKLMVRIEKAPTLAPADRSAMENLLVRGLMAAGYRVVPDGDRNAADFVLSGPLEMRRQGSRTVYGMEMAGVAAIFSYQVVRPATGQIHLSDSDTEATRAASAATAGRVAMERISVRVVRAVSERIPKAAPGRPPTPERPPTPVTPPAPVIPPEGPAPRIVMINPPEARGITRVRRRAFTIQGTAIDETGIRSVTIDGNPASVASDGGFTLPVPLRPGENRFSITATNARNRSTTREILIPLAIDGRSPQPPRPQGGEIDLWALLIGVSRYADSGMNLQYADQDALSLKGFLETQQGRLYAEVHARTLVNEQVTRDAILTHVGTHLGQAAPDDVVFIFVAGHGIRHRQTGSYYFAPHDATYDTLLSKGLRTSDFEEAVNLLSRNVEKVIIMMDTCHSGAMDASARSFGPGENLAEIMRLSSGLFILSASKSGEQSYEDGKFRLRGGDTGHGAFTYALLKGMSGHANHDGNGYISVGELFQYVSEQVPRLTGGRQHPYVRLRGTDLPFFVLK